MDLLVYRIRHDRPAPNSGPVRAFLSEAGMFLPTKDLSIFASFWNVCEKPARADI
jgi:hypothetical protein